MLAASLAAAGSLAVFAAPVAQAACGQYKFSGLTVLNQDNGYRLEWNAQGTSANGRVTAFNNRQAVANRGNVEGNINGREVFFRVFWDNGSVGTYSGAIHDNGKARGETTGDGGRALWNFKGPMASL